MSPYLIAALALLPPFAAAGFVGATRGVADRLVALQLCTALAVFAIVALAAAENRSSFLDLALALAVLTFPGTLVYAHFVERWL